MATVKELSEKLPHDVFEEIVRTHGSSEQRLIAALQERIFRREELQRVQQEEMLGRYLAAGWMTEDDVGESEPVELLLDLSLQPDKALVADTGSKGDVEILFSVGESGGSSDHGGSGSDGSGGNRPPGEPLLPQAGVPKPRRVKLMVPDSKSQARSRSRMTTQAPWYVWVVVITIVGSFLWQIMGTLNFGSRSGGGVATWTPIPQSQSQVLPTLTSYQSSSETGRGGEGKLLNAWVKSLAGPLLDCQRTEDCGAGWFPQFWEDQDYDPGAGKKPVFGVTVNGEEIPYYSYLFDTLDYVSSVTEGDEKNATLALKDAFELLVAKDWQAMGQAADKVEVFFAPMSDENLAMGPSELFGFYKDQYGPDSLATRMPPPVTPQTLPQEVPSYPPDQQQEQQQQQQQVIPTETPFSSYNWQGVPLGREEVKALCQLNLTSRVVVWGASDEVLKQALDYAGWTLGEWNREEFLDYVLDDAQAQNLEMKAYLDQWLEIIKGKLDLYRESQVPKPLVTAVGTAHSRPATLTPVPTAANVHNPPVWPTSTPSPTVKPVTPWPSSTPSPTLKPIQPLVTAQGTAHTSP